ncbi:Maf family nucleotide pyrophosphatase [Parachitinimonas caeni]|uniref:7-methyl-GTP pyrophosphatase n=1 Tax=Parachitinimonas caeni TaxID=3031301 RepID=A0ABT7DUT4_9NEIS|nr:Maf family nucleotide pyrophosphatase [Parachitinimonas caeni]MDK2123827.1 Maf family nucleotide pyrophosphatase [Parachitinimonas caeni]
MVTSTSSLPLILGSTSPFRRELLSRLQIPFEVSAPNCDETPLAEESAAETASRLAEVKARSVAKHYPRALIIGSDQVALLDGIQLGKPGNHVNAVKQLQAMRGRTLVFHTALCLYNSARDTIQRAEVPYLVNMRDYSDAQIEAYLQKEQPYQCAGSAKTEGLGVALIARMEGEDPTALIGLPLITLVTMLQNEGFPIL